MMVYNVLSVELSSKVWHTVSANTPVIVIMMRVEVKYVLINTGCSLSGVWNKQMLLKTVKMSAFGACNREPRDMIPSC